MCRNVQVDPCTALCGHTICQLCLAKLWEPRSTKCPLCKELWQVPPAISIDLRYPHFTILLFYPHNYFFSYPLVPRDNIESTHGDEISSIRSHYTDEDNKLITNFLHLKEYSNLAQEQEANGQIVQEETDHEGLSTVLRIVLKVCPPK